VVRRDYFSPEEKELYLSLFSDAKRQFSTYLDAGTVLNSTSIVMELAPAVSFVLIPRLLEYLQSVSQNSPLLRALIAHLQRSLTRMRQMACHPDLVLKSKTNANSFDADVIGEATICRICNDVAEDAIQSKCRHVFDRECIKQYIEAGIEQEVRAHNLFHFGITYDPVSSPLVQSATSP